MVCVICFDSLLRTLVENDPHTAAVPTDSSRIAVLHCGHTFHLECIRSWEARMGTITCPMCNVPHPSPAIPLFIEYDGERDVNCRSGSREQSQEYSQHPSQVAERPSRLTVDTAKELRAEVKNVNKCLEELEAKVEGLTPRIDLLEKREKELVALVKRYKFRMHQMQAKISIIKHHSASPDSSSSVHIQPDVVII
ncbi:hypothetical protein GGI06_000192 [Coemansia sp. S85]|nr:hypothetical protein GGI06_000192 [Coemansia sp. S85]